MSRQKRRRRMTWCDGAEQDRSFGFQGVSTGKMEEEGGIFLGLKN